MYSCFEWIPKIYVINIDKHVDRWKQCQNELLKNKITKYERFPGCIYNEGKEVKDRERGCSLSHFSIIQDAKKNNYPYILIFEDDIEINPILNSYEDQIKKFINNNEWELFYFGGNHLHQPQKTLNNIGQVSRTYTTHSYMIHSRIYDLLLSYYNLDMQIDVVLYEKIQTRMKSYCIIPTMIYQRAGQSYIQNLYRDYIALRK